MLKRKSAEQSTLLVTTDNRYYTELLALLSDGEYVSALLLMLRVSCGVSLNETEILDCTQEDHDYNPNNIDKSRLYQLILTKIGETGIEVLGNQLINLDSNYDFESVLIQVYDYKPDNSVTACLGKRDFKFEGKILCLSDPEEFHSTSSEILSVNRVGNSIEFRLENGSRVDLSLTGDDILNVFFWKESRYSLINYLVKDYENGREARIQDFSIRGDLVFRGGIFEVQEIQARNKVKKNLRKRVAEGFAGLLGVLSEENTEVYEHSFKLRRQSKDYCDITIYDNNIGLIAGVEVSLENRKYNLHPGELKGALVYVMSSPVSIIANGNNFRDILRIKEKVLDENKAKLEKLQEINHCYTDMVDFLKREVNGDYLDRLLANLVRNKLESITEKHLISSNDIEKLNTISTLYEKIGTKLTVQEILKRAVLDANYSKLIEKEKNVAVFKIMELLSSAFEYIDKMKGKDLVVFLGDTGSGKSTSVDYYLGLDLVQDMNNYGQNIIKIKNEESLAPGSYAKIGQSIGTSETTIVQGYPLVTAITGLDKDKNAQLVLADCPGTKDTRGLDYDLATVLSIDQTIKNSNSIKAIVLTIPYEAFLLNKANPVVELFRDLQERIKENIFTDSKVKRSLFLTITKHGAHGKPSDKLALMLEGFLNEENKRLSQINNKNDISNDSDVRNIKEKIAIWETIRDIFKEHRVNFLSVKDKITREKMLQRFASSPGIEKDKFTKAMDRSDIQRKFEKDIVMSLHTWQKLIFEQCLEILPSRINECETDIKLKKEEISNIQKESNQRQETILCIRKKVEERGIEVEILERVLKNGGQPSSDTLTQIKENLTKLTNEQLGNINRILETLATEIENSEDRLRRKKTEITQKKLESDGIQKEINELVDQINELSNGDPFVEELGGYERHAPNDQFTISTWKPGAYQRCFEEIRQASNLDRENERLVRASEYRGELTHLVYIARDYRIMPRDKAERDVFMRQGWTTDGKYRAEVTGEKYVLDLGVKPHPSGKQMVYSFKTSWEGGVIPCFSVRHTIPRVDVNEARIINKESDKTVKIRARELKEAELRQSRQEETILQAEIDNKKQEQQRKKVERDSIENHAIAAEMASLINEHKKAIRRDFDSIDSENNIIKYNKSKIDNCNFHIQNKKENLNEWKKSKFYFTIVLITQLKIAELLRRLAALGISNELGIDKKNIHSDLYDACRDYCYYFDKNIGKISQMREEFFNADVITSNSEASFKGISPIVEEKTSDIILSSEPYFSLKHARNNILKVVVIPNEPNQYEIDVPGDGSCLFYSVVFSYLLPVIGDAGEFKKRFVKLFGEQTEGAAEENRNRFLAYDGSIRFIEDNAVALEVLVNVNFRIRVVEFMRQHEGSLAPFIPDNESFSNRMHRMIDPSRREWGDELEIRAISQLLGMQIVICNQDQDDQIVPLKYGRHGENFPKKLYLVHTTVDEDMPQAKKNHYHYLVDMRCIGGVASNKLDVVKKDYNPVPTKTAAQAENPVDSGKPGTSVVEQFPGFRISYDDLTFGKRLGQGGFGVVYHGKWKKYTDVAVKQLHVFNFSEEVLKDFEHEMEIMAKLHHPQIVQLYGVCLKAPHCIVMEFMQQGSLYHVLHSSAPLDWTQRTNIALGMAKGLSFLHSHGIIHRDLKSLNVLLNEHLEAKLSDFGLATVKTESSVTCSNAQPPAGTLLWMAPELFRARATCTRQSDIYSLGMTLWELASRKLPFEGQRPEAVVTHVETGKREEIPAETPPNVAQLITHCWKANVEKRPTADQVVEAFTRSFSKP